MILVLTKSVVLLEIIELARIKIARALSIDLNKVHVGIPLKNGKLVPEFGIPSSDLEALELSAEDVKEVMSSVYWVIKHELKERLEYLDTRRKSNG
jgi:hypothetical protein